MTRARILVAEDHELMRDRVVRLLSANLTWWKRWKMEQHSSRPQFA